MRSCIRLFYLTSLTALLLAAIGVAAQQAHGTGAADPDALYADRENHASARRAADIWAARLAADPADFESAWKLARTCYWLGGQGDDDAARADLETGVEAGRTAAALEPDRPEGHFWMAANMGALAQSFGLRAGLRYRGPIKEALERVLAIDPAFQDGSADRALGRWYHKVPGLFGGSEEKSEAHLRRALAYDPDSTATHFFLAETLLERGRERRAEAVAELQAVLDAPINPLWGPEDRVFKARARALLDELTDDNS